MIMNYYQEPTTKKSDVRQIRSFAPTLQNMYNTYISHNDYKIILATIAVDIGITASSLDMNISTEKKLKDHPVKLQNWFKLWRLKINENKSTHITFSLRPKEKKKQFTCTSKQQNYSRG